MRPSSFTLPRSGGRTPQRWPLVFLLLSILGAVSTATSSVLAQDGCLAAPRQEPAFEYYISLAPIASGNGATGCGTNGTASFLAPSCKNGVAEAVTLLRQTARQSCVFMPMVDRVSVFTKTHPLDWGVNVKIFGKLNITHYLARDPFATPNENVAAAFPSVPAYLVDGVAFPVAHLLGRFVTPVFYEAANHTTLAVVPHRSFYEGYAGSLATVKQMVATAWDRACVRHVLVVHEGGDADRLVADVGAFPRPPTAVVSFSVTGTLPPPRLSRRGVWDVRLYSTATHLHRVSFARAVNGSVTAANVTALSLALTTAQKDDHYIAVQRAIHQEISLAADKNLPVATLAAPMPAAIDPVVGYRCVLGECAQGNMWADAMRHEARADVGLQLSTAIRAAAWPAGPVTLQDLYRSYPYSNQQCTLTVRGLTLYRLIHAGVTRNSYAAFEAATSRRTLLQLAGLRATVDSRRPPEDRLLAIDVYNSTLGRHEPLDRLRLYSVGTLSFVCTLAHPFSSIIKDALPGETPPVVQARRSMHNVAADYMASFTGGYTPRLSGSYAAPPPSTEAATALAVPMRQRWEHTPQTCADDEEYDVPLQSCVPCVTLCRSAQGSSNTTLTAVTIAAALIAFAVLFAVGAIALWRLRQHLAVQHCPRDPGLPFTAAFVSVKNEPVLRDRCPTDVARILADVRAAVSSAADAHRCFVARDLEAHVLVVSKDPSRAAAFASDVTARLQHLREEHMGCGVCHGQGAFGLAMIHETRPRRHHVALEFSVGLWHGAGRISHKDGADTAAVYAYGGDAVKYAAAMADAAAHHSIRCGGVHVDWRSHFAALSFTTIRDVTHEATHQSLPSEAEVLVVSAEGEPATAAVPEEMYPVPPPAVDGAAKSPSSPPRLSSLSVNPFLPPRALSPGLHAAHKSRRAGDDVAGCGAATSALEQLGGAFTTRRAAVAVVDVPALRQSWTPSSRERYVGVVREATAAVEETLLAHRQVRLAAAVGGQFTFAANASRPTGSPAAKVALAAAAVVARLRLMDGCADAVAAVDTAMAGVGASRAVECVHGVSGPGLRLLLAFARSGADSGAAPPLAVVGTSAALDDLSSAPELTHRLLDLVAWPTPPPVIDHGTAAHHPSKPDVRRVPIRLCIGIEYAPAAESASGSLSEGSLASGQGPHAGHNAAFLSTVESGVAPDGTPPPTAAGPGLPPPFPGPDPWALVTAIDAQRGPDDDDTAPSADGAQHRSGLRATASPGHQQRLMRYAMGRTASLLGSVWDAQC